MGPGAVAMLYVLAGRSEVFSCDSVDGGGTTSDAAGSNWEPEDERSAPVSF